MIYDGDVDETLAFIGIEWMIIHFASFPDLIVSKNREGHLKVIFCYSP